MIYTVTFNPAIDYVMFLDGIKTGCVNRSSSENIFFGGKGINVSMVCASLAWNRLHSALLRDLREKR